MEASDLTPKQRVAITAAVELALAGGAGRVGQTSKLGRVGQTSKLGRVGQTSDAPAVSC